MSTTSEKSYFKSGILAINLAKAFERSGATPEEINNISQKGEEGLISRFLDVYRGNAEIIDKPVLRRLYSDKEIIVGATTGDETIANASDVFTAFLDPDFRDWGTDKPSGVATKPTPTEVYKLHQNATFRKISDSLGRDINNLCWQQGQIINFCYEHPDKFRQDGYRTFFLFKVKGSDQPFVANVYLDSAELRANVYRFDHVSVWGAGDCRRLVVPQLET